MPARDQRGDVHRRDPDREAVEAVGGEQGQRECAGAEEGDGGDDGDRTGVAAGAVERGPVEADVVKGGVGAEDLEQEQRRAPLLPDAEIDQVGGEQRQPKPERRPPHQRQPVRFDERLEHDVGAVADPADHGVDRVRDHVVDLVGVGADRRREADRAGAGEAEGEVADEHRELGHHQHRGRGEDERPGEGDVVAQRDAVEAKGQAVWRRGERQRRPGQGADDGADDEAPVAVARGRQGDRHREADERLDREQDPLAEEVEVSVEDPDRRLERAPDHHQGQDERRRDEFGSPVDDAEERRDRGHQGGEPDPRAELEGERALEGELLVGGLLLDELVGHRHLLDGDEQSEGEQDDAPDAEVTAGDEAGDDDRAQHVHRAEADQEGGVDQRPPGGATAHRRLGDLLRLDRGRKLDGGALDLDRGLAQLHDALTGEAAEAPDTCKARAGGATRS